MKPNELTPDQSIAIIRDMVAQTRENLEDGGQRFVDIWLHQLFCNSHRLYAAHLHPKPDLHVGVVGNSGYWLSNLVPHK